MSNQKAVVFATVAAILLNDKNYAKKDGELVSQLRLDVLPDIVSLEVSKPSDVIKGLYGLYVGTVPEDEPAIGTQLKGSNPWNEGTVRFKAFILCQKLKNSFRTFEIVEGVWTKRAVEESDTSGDKQTKTGGVVKVTESKALAVLNDLAKDDKWNDDVKILALSLKKAIQDQLSA